MLVAPRKLNPVAVPKVSEPLLTDNVTHNGSVSTSSTVIAGRTLSVVSSFAVCRPGIESVGALLLAGVEVLFKRMLTLLVVLPAMERSVLPSPLKSPAVTDQILDPDNGKKTGACSVPSPFPNRMLTVSLSARLTTARSVLLSPLKSATLIAWESDKPVPKLTTDWNVPSPLPSNRPTLSPLM